MFKNALDELQTAKETKNANYLEGLVRQMPILECMLKKAGEK